MKLGDVVFYDDNDNQPDYSIVTGFEGHKTYAYWVREEQALTFQTNRPCYTKVGPSVIGKW